VAEPQQIPKKAAYKGSEVCQYTNTQPYVLRFWESEFPQLNPDRSRGQPMYSRRDIDLVLRIKELLYEEEYTIAGARQALEQAGQARRPAKSKAAPASMAAVRPAGEQASAERPPRPAASAKAELQRQDRLGFDTVPRERYEDALDEIAHLRLQLKELETRVRRAETARGHAETSEGAYRERAQRAAARLEELLERLG
jgi:DNA-binding transcriptional MerR regulator